MYELGKWLRRRYICILLNEYTPNDVYVRSTDTDRCLMSAYAVLEGLFPPKWSDLWNKKRLRQLIPVHTAPIDKDEVLAMRKICPKYINSLEKTMTSDYVKNISSKSKSLLDYISKHSGWDKVDVSHVATLQTNLEVYSSYNKLFIPPWTKQLNKKVLFYVAGVNHQRYTLTTELKRLLTGPFWFNLLAHFDNVLNKVAGTPKLLMLSAHDTTIVSILNCMNAFDFVPPSFGATLIWEMRRNKNGIHYINLLYKKSEKEFDTVNLGKCKVNCNYMDFKEMLRPVVVRGSDWEKDCEGK